MKEEDKISIKDIHQTFWRCRDFELSNLWQRSIFLTAFLVLCFTAYGSVLSKIVDSLEKIEAYLILNIIGYVLSILGVIFSIMWIKMSKGSKAWYEVYESAIGAIESDKGYTTKEAKEIGGFAYNTLSKYKGLKIDNHIFSGKAGEYSVSKLNIGIGQVFLVVWLAIGLGHTIATASKLQTINTWGRTDIIVSAFGILVLVGIALVFGGSKTFKSGSIEWFKSPKKQ